MNFALAFANLFSCFFDGFVHSQLVFDFFVLVVIIFAFFFIFRLFYSLFRM